MKSFGTNKKLTSLFIAALVFVLGFAIFYYVVYPKMEERDSLQYQITNLKTESKDLEKQLDNLKSNQQAEKKITSELKTEVPTERELDSLIDSIEQLESVSNTEIVDIAFNNYDAAVKETINTEEQKDGATNSNSSTQSTDMQQVDSTQSQNLNTTATDSNNQNTDATQNSEKNIAPVSPIATSSLPESLKLLTMNLTVDATDKKEIKQFLREIEFLPRIMRIDSVSYETPNIEVTNSSADTKEDPLQATIQLTTFYYVGQLDEQNEKK